MIHFCFTHECHIVDFVVVWIQEKQERRENDSDQSQLLISTFIFDKPKSKKNKSYYHKHFTITYIPVIIETNLLDI